MKRVTADLSRDVRQTFRQLRRAPGFAAVVILTLAVGIGATSAVFSVVNGVLLRPLPYESPEELVDLSTAFPTMGFEEFWVSPPEYYELREWNQVFEEVGGYRVGSASVETYDRPLRVTSAIATWTLFPTLGVEASRGRVFVEEEDRIGAEPVVLISDGLWDRGFGRDPAVLGQTIRVDGLASAIVGVLPSGFDVQDAGVDLWIPANRAQEIDPQDHVNRRGNHFLEVVARMRDGVTLDEARADLDRMEIRWEREYGSGHAVTAELHPMQAQPLRDDLLGDARPALLLLLGAVGFVLLIACANVGSLLLARSERRS
ncbi:MAG: ABC transporter permease, partial [Gemmatimonadota bacterium]